jgi:hypothetical protein
VIGVVLAQMTNTAGGYTFTSEGGFRTGLIIGGSVALLAALVAAAIPAVRQAAPSEEKAEAVGELEDAGIES